MFRNYLVTAMRNIARHKLYSFINIAGLAVGLACLLFVILFLRDELSYDKWIPGNENLYRVEMSVAIPGRPVMDMAGVPYPMAAAMQAEIPGITGKTRYFNEPMTLAAGDRRFSETVSVVDPGFFNLIRLRLLAGERGDVLRRPDSIVLSQRMARKYFGDADPVGKIITTDRGDCAAGDNACKTAKVSLRVTGVMKNLPHDTQLTGDIFIPSTSLADHFSTDNKQSWLSTGGWSFIALAPGADPQAIISRTPPLLDRTVTPAIRKFGIPSTGSKIFHIHLTPFAQVHLSSGQWQFNMTPPGSWTTIYGVGIVGILILLVACFNFMNLATARSQLRAREIALRKCVGAKRRQLIVQFLGESVLMALIALTLALALVEILLPVLAGFLQHPVAFDYGADWPLLLLIIAVAVTAGLISGSYPALVLSRFHPITVLRGIGAAGGGSGRLRAVLVVMQFAVSIGLGIAAIVVFSQISFARNIDLGFRHDNIVIVGGGNLTADRRAALVQTLRANPGVAGVGLSNMVPFAPDQSLALVRVPGRADTITLNDMAISPGYSGVYGIKLLAGRVLSESRGNDQFNSLAPGGDPLNEGRNLIVNAAGARQLGFTPREAVGKSIILNHNHVKIVGVLADTKIDGAREPVKPTAYVYDPHSPLQLSVRLKGGAIPQTLAFIDRTWHAFQPSSAIQRYFLDDSFDSLYSADERQGVMFALFVGLAIFIACLGLFGLAAFTAGRRTKEIGIRKVFGARTRDVTLLMMWQFSIPVLIANAIAWPLAWYYLHGWLEGFAYHIVLSPVYFVVAGVVALAIAWATIFAHAYRVARANPINALRYE